MQLPESLDRPLTRSDCARWDQEDPLREKRAEFRLPPSVIYLDGNSLGPLPRGVPERLQAVIEDEWGGGLIRSWNQADWISAGRRVGEQIALLIGAGQGQVMVADSVSINLFKLLVAAARLRPDRPRILVEQDGFPTDRYIAESVAQLLPGRELVSVPRQELLEHLNQETAVAAVSHVDFRSGHLFELDALTAQVHAAEGLLVVDLAHSAGALPVELDRAGVDFAVGCGYKYLNGGPGAPAFAYVAERHLKSLQQPLTGWFAHREPFAFAEHFEPSEGIDQLQCGTPPILSLLALETALEVWRDVEMLVVRRKSQQLGLLMQQLIQQFGLDAELKLASPAAPNQRGSQLAYRHPQGYAVMQALIDENIIGDFRAPDLLRFGFCPLFVRFQDVYDTARALTDILQHQRWNQPRFLRRSAVT